MRLILSPHLDDAVLSLGASIHRWAQAGDSVAVLTLCAGSPRLDGYSRFAHELHARWGFTAKAAVTRRRAEDRHALRALGAAGVYWRTADCVYRAAPSGRWLYPSVEAIFGRVQAGDRPLAAAWAGRLRRLARRLSVAHVYVPLGLGNHVDHQLTRYAAELSGLPLRYYEDYPYAQRLVRGEDWGGRAAGLTAVQLRVGRVDVEAKIAAIRAYASQISSLWPSEARMEADVWHFQRAGRGLVETVWR